MSTTIAEGPNSVVTGHFGSIQKTFKHPDLKLNHSNERVLLQAVLVDYLNIRRRVPIELRYEPNGDAILTMPRAKCDLVEYIERGAVLGWSYERVVPLLTDVYGALFHIGSRFNFIHGDVKPENVVVYLRGPTPTFALIDYGLSVAMWEAKHRGSHSLQSLWYRAPERAYPHFQNQTLIDIWSMGVLTAYLFGGLYLFQARTMNEQCRLCKNVKHSTTSSGDGQLSTLSTLQPLIYPSKYIPLIKLPLHVNPFERITAYRMCQLLKTCNHQFE